jgi:DNA repair protein SbcC/Rad50
MIKSIYLENWKTHLSSKLEFKKGTNILIGVIGSGKSSVVDAICYALYGTFPTLSNRKISLEETIMFKPTKKEYFKVVLELFQDGKTYLIEREVYSGNKINSAKVYLDNKLIKGPKKTDVDEFISNLLGIDYNLFIKVVYSQQNEIDYFLKIIPSKRKEQFDDLFGISHFEDIKINTRKIENTLLFEIEKNQALLNQINSQTLSIDLSELSKTEKELFEKNLFLEKEIKSNDEKIKQISFKLKEKKEIKDKFDKLNFEYNLNLSKLKEINSEIEKLKEIISVEVNQEDLLKEKEKLISLEKELKTKQEENKKLEILKKSIENKISFFNSRLIDYKENINRLNDSLIEVNYNQEQLAIEKEKLSVETNLLKEKEISLFSKQKDLENSIAEIKKGFSNCPVCSTPFSEEKLNDLLLSKNKSLDENLFSIKEIKNTLELLNKKNTQLILKEEALTKNKKVIDQIESINKYIIDNNKQLIILKEELENTKPIIDLTSFEKEIFDKKESLTVKEDFLKTKSKKENLIEAQTNLKKQLDLINYNEEDYLNLLAEYKNIDSNFNSLKESFKINNISLENTKKQINNYNLLNKQKEEITNSLLKINTKKQDISYFLKAIDVSQMQLRKVLIDNINQALLIIWPKVYPYKDYLSARLNANNDYILEVLTQKNDWIRVEGILSGGERACASLSIRIAISLILTKKLGLLILDEPTHNLDEKSINALSSVLEEELPDLVDQIFIVTHDNKLLETINANKYIIQRDKENDSASKIN